MKKFCLVIPVYKQELNPIEKLNFEQFKNVTNSKYNDVCIFVHPKSLDVSVFKEQLPGSTDISFDDKYFKGTKEYSQLCLSYDFYKKFVDDYEYMYIFQTDIWLFENNLEEWANKGFDYVGAPVVAQQAGWSRCPAVGNGGFSLRKLSTMCEITDKNNFVYQTIGEEKWNSCEWEDKMICDNIASIYYLSVPTIDDALDFAIDQSCEKLFHDRNYVFPMAIHAIDKYFMYWYPFMKEELSSVKDYGVIESYKRWKKVDDANTLAEKFKDYADIISTIND